ncbi:MAG: hypothetical protein CEE38_13030 [Planctomycetes bacterium B3_Pla]|nr:MAG: hypothetical protein CEE38_13030 [Planctomycetes bacterium B3_Pla]
MDEKENIETAQIEKESNTRIDLNMWDALISALVAFIIIAPLGWIEYLNGRFNIHSIFLTFLDACIVVPAVGILIIVFVIASTVQLLCNWKTYTKRKRLIRISQIGIPIVFVASFIISVFTPVEIHLWQPGYKPFTYGFRNRIRSEADIEDIRAWLKTLSKEECTGEYTALSYGSNLYERRWPDSLEWPESLKVFRPGYVNLDLDENHNPKVRLTWGGPFGHWGVEIGMEDMKIPPSDFSQWGEYRLPLEPGAYVWYELQ